LISINEKLQSAVLRGKALNKNELEIIRACAKELLGLTTGVNGTYDSAVHHPGSSASRTL
jgi:hypothetical protein